MIFITGASSGIGEACAEVFAKDGVGLILTARRKDRLERVAERLRKQYSVPVHTFVFDVRDRKAVESLAKEQRTLFSQVTVLVNNAGLAEGLDSFENGSLDEWEATIDTNVKGLLYITRAMVPFFVEKKDGYIVNLGSVAGRWHYAKGGVYCASKAAVMLLNRTLRMDLMGKGIRVTEIAPGMVETEFSVVRLKDEKKAKAVYQGMTPLVASDIADAVHYCVTRPKHVNIQELIIYPTEQAAPGVVHRTT